jgi:UMF1 family MFS transporter
MTPSDADSPTGGVANLQPVWEGMEKEQKAWYWYDWANSAYVTTIATVLLSPYLISVAEKDACGKVTDDTFTCTTNLDVLGLAISPGSLVFYVITLSTIVSALVLPVVGAAADRSAKKKNIMAAFAWAGSVAAGCLFFVAGTNWQLGVLLLFIANICLGASLVVYDAILCQIALPDDRDKVSSRGWALGYLGGGLLLAVNLALVTFADSVGLSTAMAVRISMLSAAFWWAGFTIIPYLGIRNREPVAVEREPGGLVRQSFGQLWATLRDMRNYPMTLTFLVAYLFYNDGIQTVIATSSVYGEKQLGFETTVLIATILLVQFVAFFGALLFGRLARNIGTHRVIIGGLVIWMLVVVVAFFVPAKNVALFMILAVGIGLVLGGTQALSRSFFSQLIPRGREAEYFSLYQAGERGTSWLGTLIFGLVHQWFDSYRPAIFALIIFFVVGVVLLARVNPKRGIEEAGNVVPQMI